MITRTKSEPKVVTVTELYDTSEAARQVRGVLGHLKVEFGPKTEFELRPWRVDLLDVQIAYDCARRDAAVSDLLMISFAGKARIPEALEELVEEWSMDNPHLETAVVALTHPCGTPTGAVETDPLLEPALSAIVIILASRRAAPPILDALSRLAVRDGLDPNCVEAPRGRSVRAEMQHRADRETRAGWI